LPLDNRSAKHTKAAFLPRQGAAPALEVLEAGFARESRGALIICIHGAFGGAWMWKDVFLANIASRGRSGLAFSFRGHGMSEGREKLNDVTLADYSADIIRILEAYPEPTVIIAHSLGALLTQRLIGYRPIKALVMFAPLPPDGMAFITSRLFATEPSIWRAVQDALQGSPERALSKVKDVVFSTHLSAAEIDRYLPQMVMEGVRVMVEAHLPFPILPAFLAGIPALVVGGDQDLLVPSISNVRTALYHGADCRLVPEQGHLLQLEPGAHQVADLVLDWLDQRNL
jgi:pimeloyl-ACP methyl ester carboxylesterase